MRLAMWAESANNLGEAGWQHSFLATAKARMADHRWANAELLECTTPGELAHEGGGFLLPLTTDFDA